MQPVDLHTHSTASDGTDTPAELVRKAEQAGLAALALTDHDTTAGLAEAAEAASGLSLEFVRGCEISTATDQGNMHVLGLWLPEECPTLDAFLSHLRAERHKRNVAVIDRLNKAGIPITLEEVEAMADGLVGRPHIAAALVQRGVVPDKDTAFAEWLGIDGKAYVPKVAPRPEQALRQLKELGATTILAHPLLRARPEGWLDRQVGALAQKGLDGLEAWHSHQDEDQTDEIIALAQKYGLALSGGSDYHGNGKPGLSLGIGNGGAQIGIDVLQKLKARRKSMGLPC